MSSSRDPVLLMIGAYLVADGVGSIVVYRHQHWYEHAVRVVRAGCGAVLVFLA